MSGDDLAPNATGLTAKDVLLEVRTDVKAMTRDLAVLTSQNLDQRVNAIESWKDRIDGRVTMLLVLVSVVGTVLGIAVAVVTLSQLLGRPTP